MISPPRWADKLFEWYCNPDLLEDLQGDLHERFSDRVTSNGPFIARFLFVIDVISFIRPYTLRRSKKQPSNNMMIPNIRFSIRYLVRQKFLTAVHIIGLTMGIGVAFVILLFIQNELSFEKWNSRADRIYRVNSSWQQMGMNFDIYKTPTPLAEVLRKEAAGIERVAKAFPQFQGTVAVTPDRVFSQDHILIAEPSFLDIFDIEIINGDKHALARPYQALISESIAAKFFGDEDPIGKSFKYRNKYDINVAGVYRDIPANTNLPASMLISYIDDPEFTGNGGAWYFGGQEWTTLNAMTFVLLEDRVDPATLRNTLNGIADRDINNVARTNDIRGSFSMQPLRDIHLDSDKFGGGPWVPSIDTKWLYIFGAIGIAILFLACANFVNLSTAQAIVRSKEAGIRKTIGAGKNQLIVQLLTEPLILILVSTMLALGVAMVMTSQVNLLFNKQIALSALATPTLLSGTMLFLFLIGLVAGLFPAWLIARTNPATSLKPGSAIVGNATVSWIRKTLVVTQFAISAILMTVVFSIAKQAQFLHSKDLGFRKDGIIMINVPNQAAMESFVNKANTIPGVAGISLSRSAPISDDHWWNGMGKTSDKEDQTACIIHCDEKFFDVYDLKLISGRIPPRQDTIIDARTVVVNEKMIQALDLGSPEEAIGKRFGWSGDAEIVGVVADFNSLPLHSGIYPLIFYQEREVFTHANVRIDDPTDQAIFDNLERIWKKEFPSEPYEPKMLNEEIHGYYKSEATTYTMFIVFAVIAVVISCLGLLGLCVFATVRRIKEISIRKVLGASVKNILFLLTSQFIKVVAIACALALPAAWYCVDFLLGFYSYKIDITAELFLIPLLLLISIALLTTMTQTMQASLSNPVKNLKSE